MRQIGSPICSCLKGMRTYKKRATLPAAWLQGLAADDARRNYVTVHLLGNVPETLDGFVCFYEARRKRLKEKVTELLQREGSAP